MGYVEQLLAPGEKVLVRTRRHWIVLARWAGAALLLVVLGLVMAALFGVLVPGPGYGVMVGLALAAIGLAATAPGWIRWAKELYLVTDRRVIQVEGVLRKHALDSGLGKVNDVRLTQSALGRLLGYGTLEIITAAESGINRLDDLPRPLEFKKAMMAGAQGLAAGPARAVPPPAGAPAETASGDRSAADRMAELEELRRRGLLSDAEYGDKRAEILRSL